MLPLLFHVALYICTAIAAALAPSTSLATLITTAPVISRRNINPRLIGYYRTSNGVCHGEGSMVRLSHGPAKYSEETVDSKLKREERERKLSLCGYKYRRRLVRAHPKRKEAISSVDTRS